MPADVLRASGFLRHDVQAFFRALRCGKGDKERIRSAGERVSATVVFVEPFG